MARREAAEGAIRPQAFRGRDANETRLLATASCNSWQFPGVDRWGFGSNRDRPSGSSTGLSGCSFLHPAGNVALAVTPGSSTGLSGCSFLPEGRRQPGLGIRPTAVSAAIHSQHPDRSRLTESQESGLAGCSEGRRQLSLGVGTTTAPAGAIHSRNPAPGPTARPGPEPSRCVPTN